MTKIVRTVTSLKPSDFMKGVQNERCYGLITNDLQLYTVLTWSNRTMNNENIVRADHKVVGFERANELNARRP